MAASTPGRGWCTHRRRESRRVAAAPTPAGEQPPLGPATSLGGRRPAHLPGGGFVHHVPRTGSPPDAPAQGTNSPRPDASHHRSAAETPPPSDSVQGGGPQRCDPIPTMSSEGRDHGGGGRPLRPVRRDPLRGGAEGGVGGGAGGGPASQAGTFCISPVDRQLAHSNIFTFSKGMFTTTFSPGGWGVIRLEQQLGPAQTGSVGWS